VGGRGIELELPVVDTLKGHSLNKAVARRVVLRLCSLCRWGEEKLRLPVEMQRDLSCWATQIACQNLSLFTSASNDSLPHGPCGLKSQKSLAYNFLNLKSSTVRKLTYLQAVNKQLPFPELSCQ
jgi:hypothetical protein